MYRPRRILVVAYRTAARRELADRLVELLRQRVPGVRVDGTIGSHDPLAAVEDALNAVDYDAVVISTLPARLSRCCTSTCRARSPRSACR
jgi:hypothetical protein